MKLFLSIFLFCFSLYAFAELPPCKGKKYEKFHNCYAGSELKSGHNYEGEWQNGLPHGRGSVTFSSGSKYVGGLKAGKKHGQGTYYFNSGSKYVGEFKDNEIHGQGTFFITGEKYVGEFKHEKRNGQGTFTYNDGTKQVGEWKDDNLNGFATVYNPDGSIAEQGIFENNVLVTNTINDNNFVDKNNNISKVNPESNSKNSLKKIEIKECANKLENIITPCIGLIITKINGNNSKTLGEYGNDGLTGPSLIEVDGMTLLAEYLNGKVIKQAIIIQDDSIYVGQLDDNYLNHGFGITITKDKTTLFSNFVNGKRKGDGFYVTSEGELKIIAGSVNQDWKQVVTNDHVYNGFMKNNKYSSIGHIKYKNGDFAVGSFDNGEFIEGVIFYQDNTMYIGGFKNDQFNGNGVFIYDEMIAYGSFKDGLLNPL